MIRFQMEQTVYIVMSLIRILLNDSKFVCRIFYVHRANLKTRVKKQVFHRHALKTSRVFRLAVFTRIFRFGFDIC